MLLDDFTIVTEMRMLKKSAALETSKRNKKLYQEGSLIVTDFAQKIISNVNQRIDSIEENKVRRLIAGSFRDWNKENLKELTTLANRSGRDWQFGTTATAV